MDQGSLGNETDIVCFVMDGGGLESCGHEQGCMRSCERLKSVIHTSLAECKTMCKSREDKRELNSKIKPGSICVPLEH